MLYPGLHSIEYCSQLFDELKKKVSTYTPVAQRIERWDLKQSNSQSNQQFTDYL